MEARRLYKCVASEAMHTALLKLHTAFTCVVHVLRVMLNGSSLIALS